MAIFRWDEISARYRREAPISRRIIILTCCLYARYIAEISAKYRKNKARYLTIIVIITFAQYCRRPQPEDQCRHQPCVTSRKIKDEIKVRENKPPLVNQQCVVYNFQCVTCVMQGMSAIRADIFTNELKNKRDRPLEITSRSNTIWPQMTLRSFLKF